jgi:hypothetical protein
VSPAIFKFIHNSSFLKTLTVVQMLLLSCATLAQEDKPAELSPAVLPNESPGDSSGEVPGELPGELPGQLPDMEHFAAALSDNESRVDTLLSMAVLAYMLAEADVPSLLEIEARFQDERAWLDQLAARFPVLPLRSSALDPTSWYVLLELDQHQIIPPSLVSPKGPDTAVLIRQLFDRSDQRLAAAVLPEVLMRMESESGQTWQDLLSRATGDEAWLAILNRIYADFFDTDRTGADRLIANWQEANRTSLETEAEVQSPAEEEKSRDVIGQALASFQALAASAIQAGAPDALLLQELRFTLIMSLPDMDESSAREATQLLRVATAIDGLHENKYLSFVETLIWVVMEMLLPEELPVEELLVEELPVEELPLEELPVEELPVEEPPVATKNSVETDLNPETENEYTAPVSRFPRVLVQLLPQLSNAFARDFSNVDPRINTILASAFDIVQSLEAGPPDVARQTYLTRELADAVAQLVLMIPDMDFYFDQPVRRPISEEINICTSIVAATGPGGEASLSREQFERCLASLAELSETMVRNAELAGDPDGPFGAEQLRRELKLTPWQRINYALGFLHERNRTDCQLPDEPLPNPLEWAALVTVLAWFAEQSPVYFQTPANEALVVRMRQQGIQLLATMEQQVVCFSGTGKGLGDPVRRSLSEYHHALEDLAAGLRETELVFREEKLAPDADIVLSSDAHQQTAYRPEGLLIGPCQVDNVCEMNGELEATRALIGLFPSHYLIADQSGLGKIEICYDNMQWVRRRSEPIRPDDPNVANYYGHLSFDLIGRYVEDGQIQNVFGSNFISPDEYHYLFAGVSDEVLDDNCASEWIGTKIVTNLRGNSRFRVVPDRLTYLASARTQPSQIINSNWSRGAEWRDWFVTGLGVTPFEFKRDEKIFTRINQQLKALYQAEESMLYSALLRPPSRGGTRPAISLYDQMIAVDTAKTLMRTQMALYFPDPLLDSDELRGLLEGTGALVDWSVLRRFREGNVPVDSINSVGKSRLAEFRAKWNRQPKAVRSTGSVALSVAHAIARLNALYQAFFAIQPNPVETNSSPL